MVTLNRRDESDPTVHCSQVQMRRTPMQRPPLNELPPDSWPRWGSQVVSQVVGQSDVERVVDAFPVYQSRRPYATAESPAW